MGWIVAALMTTIGAGGWVLAIFFFLSADDMESELTAARAALAKTKAELSQLSDEVGVFRENQGSLAELKSKIDDTRAELNSLRTDAKKYREIPRGASREYLTITKAKIRAGSSTTTSQVAIVSAGVPLSVYETTEDGTWHKIGLTGYIYHELLKPVP